MTKKELIEELTCGISTLSPWAESLITKFEETTYQQGRTDALDELVAFANTMPIIKDNDGVIRPMWLEEMAEQLKEEEDD